MTAQYCPAWGPGSPVCPRSICDCFIDEFPDDMEAAGNLHPEFFTVMPPVPDPRLPDAVQWNDQSGKSLLQDFTGLDIEYGFDAAGGWALIPTGDGYLTVRSGDWVIRDAQGEFRVEVPHDGVPF